MSAERRRLRLALLRGLAVPGSLWRTRTSRPLLSSPRVLLIRPDHIGDLLFATPALRSLRQSLPHAYIACMVGPWAKPVLENNPHLDELIVCEFPGFGRAPKPSLLAPYQALTRWSTILRSLHFDMAIVLRFDHWWGALLTYWARIPHRIGYAIPECQPFLTQAVAYDCLRHEVLQNWTLAQCAVEQVPSELRAPDTPFAVALPVPPVLEESQGTTAGLEFRVMEPDQAYVADYLASHAVGTDDSFIAIHPGAGAAVKLWDAEAWAQVADAVAERCQARIVITGGRDELDLAWSVYAHMRAEAIVAAGDTSLGQLAALFQRCRLVLGPDCGPLHLAVAVGTPTVHLFGPVDARKFGPWGPSGKHLVLVPERSCIPCNRLDYSEEELPEHPCVREISVEAVLQAALGLIQATWR
jgi:ADP-heptose:LPS heptosyltransferase